MTQERCLLACNHWRLANGYRVGDKTNCHVCPDGRDRIIVKIEKVEE